MKPINLSGPVEILFEQWPDTVHLFLQHQMACPGCQLAKFETLEGALQIYQIEHRAFLARLEKIIAESARNEYPVNHVLPDMKEENQA